MEVNWSINMLGMLNIQGGMGEALDDQVLSLQMTSALTLDPCQVPISTRLLFKSSNLGTLSNGGEGVGIQ